MINHDIAFILYIAATNQPTEQSTDQTTGQVTDGNQANVFDVFPFGKLIKLACCCMYHCCVGFTHKNTNFYKKTLTIKGNKAY